MVRADRALSIYSPPQTTDEEKKPTMAVRLACRLKLAQAARDAGDLHGAGALCRLIVEERIRGFAMTLGLTPAHDAADVLEQVSGPNALRHADRLLFAAALTVGNLSAHIRPELHAEQVDAALAIAQVAVNISLNPTQYHRERKAKAEANAARVKGVAKYISSMMQGGAA